MRKFSSYGPIDIALNYYVPRQTLIDTAVEHLVGEERADAWRALYHRLGAAPAGQKLDFATGHVADTRRLTLCWL